MKTLLKYMSVAAILCCLAPTTVKAQCAPDESRLDISIFTDAWPGEVGLEIYDDCTGQLLGFLDFFSLTSTFTQYDFFICLDPAGNYRFEIYDLFGDGICCFEGNGSYSLTWEGNLIHTGGDYGSGETVYFGSGDPCPEVEAPANDLCANAVVLDCNTTVSGTTLGATLDGVGTCGVTTTAPGVWYKVTGDGSVITVSTCNQANFDTKISVFTGSCDGLVCFGGIDDTPGCAGFTTEGYWCSEPGVDYYILIHGYASAVGDFDLTITCEASAVNDDICDAIPLTMNQATPFTNLCATVEDGEPAPGYGTVPGNSCNSQDGWCNFEGAQLQATVWFTFQAPSSGWFNIYAYGFDTQLAIYESDNNGCDGNMSLIAANDDGGQQLFTAFIDNLYCLDATKTYYIQVDGFAGSQGNGIIYIEGEEDAKVEICHKRPKKFDMTLEVSACAVYGHMQHGDEIGACANGQKWEGEYVEGVTNIDGDVNVASINAYPNPFGEQTTLEFALPYDDEQVTLDVFTISGQKVATLFDGPAAAGATYKVNFEPATGGAVFIYTLQTTSDRLIGRVSSAK